MTTVVETSYEVYGYLIGYLAPDRHFEKPTLFGGAKGLRYGYGFLVSWIQE